MYKEDLILRVQMEKHIACISNSHLTDFVKSYRGIKQIHIMFLDSL